jgi:hypothetical protein
MLAPQFVQYMEPPAGWGAYSWAVIACGALAARWHAGSTLARELLLA